MPDVSCLIHTKRKQQLACTELIPVCTKCQSTRVIQCAIVQLASLPSHLPLSSYFSCHLTAAYYKHFKLGWFFKALSSSLNPPQKNDRGCLFQNWSTLCSDSRRCRAERMWRSMPQLRSSRVFTFLLMWSALKKRDNTDSPAI